MTDPARGYVTDVRYADTFFRELSPAWLNYVAVTSGCVPRDLTQPFTYLELGCGLGRSTVVNAAAFPHGDFHACDINTVHIEAARTHAQALGVDNVRLHAVAFDALAALDLPAFDFIVLHGVYSWVDAAARADVRRVLRERLKPAGLAYISYNCQPGWSVEVPLRRFLIELGASASGDAAQRVEHALAALGRLEGGKLRYLANHPAAASAIAAYRKGASDYLAHEFFNETWEPFFSADIADEMGGIGLSYVGSATLADNHPTLLVDEATIRGVATLPTARQQSLALDFATDRRFRRDVFVRATQPLTPAQHAKHFENLVLGCSDEPADLAATVQVPRGELSFHPAFVDELRALLSQGSTTMARAVADLGGAGRSSAEIARNLVFLTAAGVLMPYARVHRADPDVRDRRPASGLVARALSSIAERRATGEVPSDVLGNGIEIAPFEALAITQWLAGVREVGALARRVRSAAALLDLEQRNRPPYDMSHAVAQRVIENLVPTFIRVGLLV